MGPVVIFDHMFSTIHHIFHIVFSCFHQTYWELLSLQNSLVQASHGQFPIGLVSPENLTSILIKIQRQIPQSFKLPRNVAHDSHWYYKHLKCLLLPHGNSVHIMTAIPLAKRDSLYTIYEAITTSVPHLHAPILAQYGLETNHIAVASDKSSYVLLSQRDVDSCKLHATGYCSFHKPVRSFEIGRAHV